MTDLQSLLSAKRAAIEAPEPQPEELTDDNVQAPLPDVTEHGEIVPAADAPPPVEYAPQYPAIPPKVVGGLPYVRDYMKLARTIHSTEMVPATFKGRPDAILATFLRGYEMGFGPMQSLDSFNVIQGTVGLKPEAMRALIMDNGHQIILEDVYAPDGSIDAICADCRRRDWPAEKWVRYTYSMADARQAGLLGKDNWKKMPRAMLDARATAGAGRRYFADVLAGMSYTPEEIRDFSGNDREEQQPSTPSPSVAVSEPSTPEPSPPPEATEQPAPPKRSRRPAHAAQPPATPEPPAPSDAPSTDANGTDFAHAAPESATEIPATPAPASSTEPDAATSDVRLEMRKALTALIASLEPMQQPLCRAFLAQQGYADISKLPEHKIQEAINIAAGWPDTCVVDAEVVDDEAAMNEPEQQSF